MLQGLLLGAIRLLVGAYPHWETLPDNRQTLYFANHSSHLDTLVLLAALPADLRRNVRPVAARDYWTKTALHRFIAQKVLNAILLDRRPAFGQHPLLEVERALQAGSSILIFPEGTRRPQAVPGDFKSGLHYLAAHYPQVRLQPVYLENLYRAMPKGALLPVPLLCKAWFGTPFEYQPETKAAFLSRARDAVMGCAKGPLA